MRQCTVNAELYEESSLADASGYIAALCFLHEEAVNNPSYPAMRRAISSAFTDTMAMPSLSARSITSC